MSENPMDAEQIAKQALELAARAEELARHAHETAGIDEQLAQLEAELGVLDAEEAVLVAGGAVLEADDQGNDAPSDWADLFTERVGSLGDRIAVLVDQVTEAAMHRVDIAFDHSDDDDDRVVVEEHTVDVERAGRVDIDSNGGSVRVTPHAANTVAVEAHGRRMKDRPRLVEVITDDAGVSIKARSPRSWRGRGIRLDVKVPVESALVVATGGGGVVIEDVHGRAEVRTGGGSIRLHGAREQAQLTTGGGSIELSDFDGTVEARTGGGSIQIDGRLSGAISLRTGGGNITVRVAEGTNLHVEARGTGSATDFDTLHAERGRITGDIGDGTGGTLDAKTGGGTIRIIN